jgi:hypothetical protein
MREGFELEKRPRIWKLLLVLVGLCALAVLAVGGVLVGAQVEGEPSVETQTFTNVVTYTVPTETVVSTETQTVTVTVTAPTEPPGETVEVTNPPGTLGWRCAEPIDLALLKVTVSGSSSDDVNAVTLDPGCTGTIDRIEIETNEADGIKCRNNAVTNAHDLLIGGGYIRSTGFAPGAHADGVQCMGGDRIALRGVLIDFSGAPGGGGFYPSLGGAGTGGQPEDVVCDGCHIIHGATSVRVDASVRSGVRNSVLCDPQGQSEAAVAVYANPLTSPVGVSSWPVTIQRHTSANVSALSDGNVAVANTDPRCSEEP